MAETQPPSPTEDAFNCPYGDCRAYSQQRWFAAHAIEGRRWSREDELAVSQALDDYRRRQLAAANVPTTSAISLPPRPLNKEVQDRALGTLIERFPGGVRAAEPFSGLPVGTGTGLVEEVRFSRCDRCRRLAVWLDQKLLYPENASAVEAPHEKMPQDIADDYQEAAAILDKSPRGAAALARLGLQKLLAHLGEPGDIEPATRKLMAKGLDERMGRLMDSIRIHGNLAVHPGEIDVSGARDSAVMVLRMLNRIVEKLIADPAAEKEFYEGLPERKRKAAEEKDAKARTTGSESS